MEQRKCVLIIDENPDQLDELRTTLEQSGFEVLVARDGIQGEALFRSHLVHLVVLDIMIPSRNGLALCRELRASSDVPLIILSARRGVQDVVRGLEFGADDYIYKPFDQVEVVTRINVVLARVELRQQADTPTRVQSIGEISVDLDRKVATRSAKPITLTPTEFDLLAYLITNAGRTLDRETLLRNVWGYDHSGKTNLVDVAIRRLREKLEPEPSSPTYLLTVRGQGYRFAAPARPDLGEPSPGPSQSRV